MKVTSHRTRSRSLRAFTLLEVMIAMAIFFTAMFSILSLVSQNLRAAHSLTQHGPTIGMAAAQVSLTNRLTEGGVSGDFGELYPDYTWEGEVSMVTSNGYFQVDLAVLHGHNLDSQLRFWLFRPGSPPRGNR